MNLDSLVSCFNSHQLFQNTVKPVKQMWEEKVSAMKIKWKLSQLQKKNKKHSKIPLPQKLKIFKTVFISFPPQLSINFTKMHCTIWVKFYCLKKNLYFLLHIHKWIFIWSSHFPTTKLLWNRRSVFKLLSMIQIIILITCNHISDSTDIYYRPDLILSKIMFCTREQLANHSVALGNCRAV